MEIISNDKLREIGFTPDSLVKETEFLTKLLD